MTIIVPTCEKKKNICWFLESFTFILFWRCLGDRHACLQGDSAPVVDLEDEVPGPGDPIFTWCKNTHTYAHIKGKKKNTEKVGFFGWKNQFNQCSFSHTTFLCKAPQQTLKKLIIKASSPLKSKTEVRQNLYSNKKFVVRWFVRDDILGSSFIHSSYNPLILTQQIRITASRLFASVHQSCCS